MYRACRRYRRYRGARQIVAARMTSLCGIECVYNSPATQSPSQRDRYYRYRQMSSGHPLRDGRRRRSSILAFRRRFLQARDVFSAFCMTVLPVGTLASATRSGWYHPQYSVIMLAVATRVPYCFGRHDDRRCSMTRRRFSKSSCARRYRYGPPSGCAGGITAAKPRATTFCE